MKDQKIPIVSFIAKSGSGKTTLLEKVITALKIDGVKVATIKHAHHVDIDRPGKDTWRMAQAGADKVVITSPDKIALIEKVEKEKTLNEVIAKISGVDLILIEGFKASGKPAIEVYRSDAHHSLLDNPGQLLALASDVKWDLGVPCYDINDVEGVVSEIKKYMLAFASE